MLVRKAYRFRLYPNLTQQEALAIQFGHARFVYNYFLQMRRKNYEATGKGLYYRQTAYLLTKLKQQASYSWLTAAHSQVLQQALKDLERAYQNFFAGRSGYPHFKSRRGKQAIRYPQRVKVDLSAKRIYLPKVGWVKTVFHRPIDGRLKNVTVSKTKSGRYFVSIQVEVEVAKPVCQGGQIGLDLGLSAFAILSDGQKIDNPRYLLHAERRLRRLKKSLSRRKLGSASWESQRQKVARQYEKVSSQRKDFQHQLSIKIVRGNRLIAIEDLNIKGMVRNRQLAKHILDVGWGQFLSMLAYKGEWYGCEVVKINRWYPSSKTCSQCGAEMETIPLHVRSWACPLCGAFHGRDINAAINILKQTTVGTTESKAGGVHVSPASITLQAGTQKPETLQFAEGSSQ